MENTSIRDERYEIKLAYYNYKMKVSLYGSGSCIEPQMFDEKLYTTFKIPGTYKPFLTDLSLIPFYGQI